MQASESVISVCFNTSLLKYGGDIAVGAMTILTSVMQFAMLPLQGLAQGAQPVLSYNYGAKNAARVKQAFRLLLTSSLVYSTVLWGCIQLFPQVFASIFTPNEDLIVFAAKALRIYCGVLVLFGIQIACQMTFVSLGNAPCSIIVAVVRKFVLLIPLIYLMPQLVSNQVMGVYMAEPGCGRDCCHVYRHFVLAPVPQIHDGAGAGSKTAGRLIFIRVSCMIQLIYGAGAGIWQIFKFFPLWTRPSWMSTQGSRRRSCEIGWSRKRASSSPKARR